MRPATERNAAPPSLTKATVSASVPHYRVRPQAPTRWRAPAGLLGSQRSHDATSLEPGRRRCLRTASATRPVDARMAALRSRRKRRARPGRGLTIARYTRRRLTTARLWHLGSDGRARLSPFRPALRASLHDDSRITPGNPNRHLQPLGSPATPCCDDRLSSGHHRRLIRRATLTVLPIRPIDALRSI